MKNYFLSKIQWKMKHQVNESMNIINKIKIEKSDSN